MKRKFKNGQLAFDQLNRRFVVIVAYFDGPKPDYQVDFPDNGQISSYHLDPNRLRRVKQIEKRMYSWL